MPGIREARTPLAVGALWIVCVFLFVAPHWAELSGRFAGIGWLASVLAGFPQLYVIAGLAFVAYLLGVATQPISVLIARRLLRPFFRAQEVGAYPDGKLRRAFFRFVRSRIDVSEYLGPLNDAIMSAYVRAGLPASMALHYPAGRLTDRLDATALQLWKAQPDQYQEYDRLRAERDFRRGVWLPLIGVGVALGVLVVWWIGLLVAVGACVLLYQTWGLDHRRRVLIANALFQNLIEDAELKAMVQVLATLRLPRGLQDKESAQCAITAVAFAKTGDFESADELTWEAAYGVVGDAMPESRASGAPFDVESKASKRAIEALANDVRGLYRKNRESEQVTVFDWRLEKRLADLSKQDA